MLTIECWGTGFRVQDEGLEVLGVVSVFLVSNDHVDVRWGDKQNTNEEMVIYLPSRG